MKVSSAADSKTFFFFGSIEFGEKLLENGIWMNGVGGSGVDPNLLSSTTLPNPGSGVQEGLPDSVWVKVPLDDLDGFFKRLGHSWPLFGFYFLFVTRFFRIGYRKEERNIYPFITSFL